MNSIREGIESLMDSSGGSSNVMVDKSYFAARVIYVMLDDSDKDRFEKYGGLSGIGTIEAEMIKNGNIFRSNVVTAKPLNRNITRYPLVNEIVKIESAPNFNNQNFRNQFQTSYYYSDIIGTWDNVEHNITPITDSVRKVSGDDNLKSYINASNGIQKSENTSNINDIDSIKVEEFTERGDVRLLQPNPGDIILQGRLGNSIRFSSSNESKNRSPWMGSGSRPVLVIRNGQKTGSKDDSWNPIYEDVNNDGSSFYMLSGQKLDFNYASKNFESLGVTPKNISNIVEPFNSNIPSASINQSDKINSVKLQSGSYQSSPNSASVTSSNDDISFLPDYEDDINFTQGFDNFSDYLISNDIGIHGEVADKNFSTNVSFPVLGNPYTSPASILNPDKYLAAIYSHEQGQTGQGTVLQGTAFGKYQIVLGTRKIIYSGFYKNSMSFSEFETKYKTDPKFEYDVARKLAVDNINSSRTAAIAIGKWYDPATAISEQWESVPRPDYGNKRKMGDFVNFVSKNYR